MYTPKSPRLCGGKYKPLRANKSLSKLIQRTKAPPLESISNNKHMIPDTPPPSISDPQAVQASSRFAGISFQPEFPIIVTAYTTTSHLGDYYQRAVTRLSKSCIKFNLPFVIFPLSGVGEWLHGCNLKPTVILHALHLFKKPILWIDADAQVFQYPNIFADSQFKYDIALAAEAPPSGHWLSGTLYCKPSAIDFIDEWRKCTPHKTNQDTYADEITIKNLWYDSNPNTRPNIHLLPQPYNAVVHTQTDTSSIIIGHYIREDVAPMRNCEAVPVPEL